MKTITIYSFNELDEKAKRLALDNVKVSDVYTDSLNDCLADFINYIMGEVGKGIISNVNSFILNDDKIDYLIDEIYGENDTLGVRKAYEWHLLGEISYKNNFVNVVRRTANQKVNNVANAFERDICNWLHKVQENLEKEKEKFIAEYFSDETVKDFIELHEYMFTDKGIGVVFDD